MKKPYNILLQLIIFSLIIVPFKVNASATKMTCSYNANIDNNNITLNYNISSDEDITLAFFDGTDILNNALIWYHDTNFKNDFLLSKKVTEKVNTCPTLILDKKNNIITIYSKLKDKDSCNGVCTKLEAKKVKADNKNQVSLVVDSGIIKLEDIDLYFRLLKDGTKQWSVNGINYTSVDDSIESIYLSKKFVKKVFKNNKVNNLSNPYICDNTIVVDSKECHSSNAMMVSTSISNIVENSEKKYMAQKKLGPSGNDMKCTDDRKSLLGNPNDQDSVAWLVQKVLDYVKIIGPIIVIIFSSIDYLRALIQSDDETMAKLNKKLITRIVLVLLLFFVPTLVSAILALFGLTNSQTCNLE